jgi:hypothetical protein
MARKRPVSEEDRRALILKELLRLKRANGGILYPQKVVEAAEDEGNVMHDEFDWDNELAGHRRRLGQARSLIRSYPLERQVSAPVQSRAYEFERRPPLFVSQPGVTTSFVFLGDALHGPTRKGYLLGEAAVFGGHAARLVSVLEVAGYSALGAELLSLLEKIRRRIDEEPMAEAGG